MTGPKKIRTNFKRPLRRRAKTAKPLGITVAEQRLLDAMNDIKERIGRLGGYDHHPTIARATLFKIEQIADEALIDFRELGKG